MNNFNIGDKVKFLHSKDKEIGVVTKKSSKTTVFVDFDGFEQEVSIDDIVLAQPTSKINEHKASEIEVSSTLNPGFYLAFDFTNNYIQANILNLNRVNAEITIFKIENDNPVFLIAGSLPAFSSLVFHNFNSFNLEQNSKYLIHLLPWIQGLNENVSPIKFEFVLKHKKLLNTEFTPILNRKTSLFQISTSESPKLSNLTDFPKNNTETKNTSTNINLILESKHVEIDLHLEKIDSKRNFNENDNLNFQLNFAMSKLEEAILNKKESITFIHGAGSGILKNKILEKIKDNSFILRHEYENPERHLGATKIYLKYK